MSDQIPGVARPGDIWQLGAHQLACGDAGDAALIGQLMQGEQATLCFTSPPYIAQRIYAGVRICDWDALMQSVFAAAPMREDGQVLVNLGLVYKHNEVQLYWECWSAWMQAQGWRRYGWYVWDQGHLPGRWYGRLAPSFEFVFHFNKVPRAPNKIVPCKWAGTHQHLREDGTASNLRGRDGKLSVWNKPHMPVQPTRVPDSVIRITRNRRRLGTGLDHPAVFPIGLPEHLIAAYSDAGEIVYEPFCGSGTSLLAAEKTGRVMRAIELVPRYVDVALVRFQRAHPKVPITLLNTNQSWRDVAAQRLPPAA